MAELILTSTRDNTSNAWFTVNPNTINSFTPDERTVLIDSKKIMDELPGLISSQISEISDSVRKIVYTFDTFENANSAMIQLKRMMTDETSPLYKRKEILLNKQSRMGQNITTVVSVTS
jgi:antibiotic biosynthesis monooxygenase (ABM) superfamily enzyme